MNPERKPARKLERFAHTKRDARSGQYARSTLCDACGKPVGTNYFTDEEVCGGGDGPGFRLCDRKRCFERLEKLNVDERRALYEETRRSLGDDG